MNIYEKLQKIKVELLDCNLKKTGKNGYSDFSYYELSDIMPDIIKLCNKYKVCTVISFMENSAKLSAMDCENKETLRFVEVIAPTAKLEIKGANAIQALGGMQTYMRRYLYMAMFDITENDHFDSVSGTEEKPKTKEYRCVDCGTEFKPFIAKDGKKYNAGQVYHMAENSNFDKKARCKACKIKKEGDVQNDFI